ncbi:MAG: serine/threonine protein kinase, partial [Planctomycetaceae bacterium]|nr:serine/threonine protein kinase [Planctomycetaceae bacterium]
MEERRIFLELLDLNTPEERADFLDSACGSDSVLRERITTLLQRHHCDQLVGEIPKDLPETGVGLGDTFGELQRPDASRSPGTEVTSVLPATPREITPGESISHYRIQRLIGRGGAGAVYEAFDSKLNRRVALKFLSKDLATDDTARERFLREARAVAAVDHPHVVTIYSVEDGPLPHLVMELVTGETLASRLETIGSLGVKDILRIGQQIAAGLAAAHREGVIHRDLKPANILLKKRRDAPDGEPQVVIVDFGLAKGEEDIEITKIGYIAGTPAYMSPEQAMGRPLDARSDLFSLG